MEQQLIGKIFKILPIFETSIIDCEKYLTALIIEMSGQDNLNETTAKSLIMLKGLKKLLNEGESVTQKEVKSTVFRCIHLIQDKGE